MFACAKHGLFICRTHLKAMGIVQESIWRVNICVSGLLYTRGGLCEGWRTWEEKDPGRNWPEFTPACPLENTARSSQMDGYIHIYYLLEVSMAPVDCCNFLLLQFIHMLLVISVKYLELTYLW